MATHISLALYMMLSEWAPTHLCHKIVAEAKRWLDTFFPVHNLQGEDLYEIELYKGKTGKLFKGH
jgi:hypothetical protein